MGQAPDSVMPNQRMPKQADADKAMMNALAYAETERKLRASSGRRGAFGMRQPSLLTPAATAPRQTLG